MVFQVNQGEVRTNRVDSQEIVLFAEQPDHLVEFFRMLHGHGPGPDPLKGGFNLGLPGPFFSVLQIQEPLVKPAELCGKSQQDICLFLCCLPGLVDAQKTEFTIGLGSEQSVGEVPG